MSELKELITKFALQNAVKYEGTARVNNIIPKVLGTNPDLKSEMKSLVSDIKEVVDVVNKLSPEEQLSQLREIAPEMLEKKEPEKKGLKELEDVKAGGVVMRFAPSPSGPMHIGHAITGGLTSLYVKKYGGKFFVRIEDTNSSNIYAPAYDMIKEEGDWLFGNVTEYVIQSKRLEIYYDYAKKLLDMGKIFICTCSPDKYHKYSKKMLDCPCKKNSLEKNKELWDKMHNEFRPGDAVARYKTNLETKNPALMNFPLFRINDDEHPLQGKKYRVWPLMNMSVTVDDIELGMTHIIRAKDHLDNSKKQKMIYDDLGIEFPKTYFLGRLKFDDMEISSSKTKEKISNGEYSGWDDIRLPFIAALKKRGFRPEAFMRFTQEIGLTQTDKVYTKNDFYKTLAAFNKDVVEPNAKHFFLMKEPVNITLVGDTNRTIELDLNPETMKGGRILKTSSGRYLIEKSDVDRLKDGAIERLMDCVNFKKNSDGTYEFLSEDYESFKEGGHIIMHWLPDDESQLTKIFVRMPDNTVFEAVAEKGVEKVKEGEIVQFERFGFAAKTGNEFWFNHR